MTGDLNLTTSKQNLFISIMAWISAVLLLLMLGITFSFPPPQPADMLIFFESNKNAFVLLAMFSLGWSVSAVPVILGLVALAKSAQQGLTLLGSAVLLAGGVLLSGITTFLYMGVCFALYLSQDVNQAPMLFETTFWSQFYFFMTDPPLFIWGAGQFILGIIFFRAKITARWIAVLTITGGFAGLFTLFIFQTPILAILQYLSFLVLTVYCAWHYRNN